MKVYEAISAVGQALAQHGISKDRKNQQQGYSFRGIDDCLNALATVLPANKLVILPEVLERDCVERQTKSGGSLFYTTVKVRFQFTHTEDQSKHDVVIYGEAMDSGDKATNKAMSAAYKYAVLLTFCIPTEGDNDADAHTHEVVTKNKQTAQAKIAELKREAMTAGEDGGERAGESDTLPTKPLVTQQGSDAPPPSFMEQASAVTDWRAVIDDTNDLPGLQKHWHTITQDPQLDSTQKVDLFKLYQARVKAIPKKK